MTRKTRIVGEVGIRATIYVEPKDWETVKDSAWMARTSAGNYLMGLHKSNLEMRDSAKPAQPEKFESHKPRVEIDGDGNIVKIKPDPDRQPQLEREEVQPDPANALGSLESDALDKLPERILKEKEFKPKKLDPGEVAISLDVDKVLPEESDSDTKIKVSKTADDLAQIDPGKNMAIRNAAEFITEDSLKEPKCTKHGNCVDCGSLIGHRAGCEGV